jgi:hypothetical protein
MYYKGPRGRFDPHRTLIANKVMTINGVDVRPGDCVDTLEGLTERKKQTLWSQRKLIYGDDPRADKPAPVPPVTRPVREIIEQRKASDPEFAAALDDEKRSEALDRLQSLGQEFEQTPVPADWRKQHHKTIVKLANDLGADVSKKADAIAAIEAELERRGD